jgi:hypothetical protein
MKLIITLLACLAAAIFARPLSAQDKPKTEDRPKTEAHPTPLKIQTVFSEFEGDKKIKSIPYGSLITADPGRGWETAKIRIGNRVPLYAGKEGGFQYIDVGTNLDYRVERLEESRFGVRVALERSWVQGDISLPLEKDTAPLSPETPRQVKQPVIGQFKTEVYLVLREGQTVESTVATDPLTGRLMKIELTLTAAK